MRLYSDTELDNDIKYVQDIVSRCTSVYKNLEHDFLKLNKTAFSRIEFILSQFGNLSPAGKIRF